MAQKQCAFEGCEELFETVGARKFCDAHTVAKPKKAPRAELDDVKYVVSIDLCESQLDRIWCGASLEEKGLAIQSILDYQREEE